jgi:methylmalonyl-CoA mutase
MTMTDASAPLRTLAEDFAVQSEADWRALVEKTLKGGGPESLVSRTADGIGIQALYRAGAQPSSHLARAKGDADAPAWDIRVVATHPSPTEANDRLLDDLGGGAASVLLVLDDGRGEGVRATGPADLAAALRNVDLLLATGALDAGFDGPRAADWLAAAAKSAPRARLAFHLDPLTAFASAGRSPGPVAAHITLAADTARGHAETYPQASLFLASGRAVHEAGGSDAQELAFAAAAAVTYAKALVASGLSIEQAFAGVALGVSLDADYFGGVAKLRAARMLWNRIAGASGVAAPARIEARSSRRMLATMDSWVNLIRLTAACFAGAVGGADAMVLEPFTQPLGLPGELARRQARNTQLILMEEAHLARVDDPAEGAWFLESYSRDLAQAAWALFQGIEARGGAEAALTSGWLAGAVATVRAARQAEFASGAAALVGVNLHPFAGAEAVGVEAAPSSPAALRPAPPLLGPDSRCTPLPAIRWSEPFERASASEGAKA